ncbi:hypothetical protein C8R43DRAFT_1199110 [Mycena crocata]|nr:hypothetical protein C8R43DRAFT_1199110 [Mycena crocata]
MPPTGARIVKQFLDKIRPTFASNSETVTTIHFSSSLRDEFLRGVAQLLDDYVDSVPDSVVESTSASTFSSRSISPAVTVHKPVLADSPVANDSLSVAPSSSLREALEPTLDSIATPPYSSGIYGSPWDQAHRGQNTEGGRQNTERGRWLELESDFEEPGEEGNTSVVFKVSDLDKAQTLHDFLLTTSTHINSAVSDLGTGMHVSPRKPRGVEIVPKKDQLTELIYLPSLSSRMHNFLHKIDPDENLEKVNLDAATTRRLCAGPSIANSSKVMRSEADVEFHVRVTQGDIVRRKEKATEPDQEPLYPQKGTPVHRAGHPSHAFPDIEVGKTVIEVKTILSINALFMAKLLGFDADELEKMLRQNPDAFGLIFDFHPPQSIEHDTLGSTVQSLVQLWTQLLEKGFSFGEGTSQTYSYFVVKDPETPGRLIISPCYATFPQSVSDATETGIYMAYDMFRIANNSEYSAQFLEELREDLKQHGALVPAVTFDPGQFPPTVDLKKGTVGAKIVPNGKQGVLRTDLKQVKYKDLSSSRIGESLEVAEQEDTQNWLADAVSVSFAPSGSAPALSTEALHSTPNGPARFRQSKPQISKMTDHLFKKGIIVTKPQPGPSGGTRSRTKKPVTQGGETGPAEQPQGKSKKTASTSKVPWK